MTDKQHPKKSELILSKNRSLAIKSSGLVKRGLELIDRGKKRRVEVLIGDWNSGIGDAISAFLIKKTKDKFDLKIRFSCFGEEILDLAENGEIDIFILILNNLITPSANAPLKGRLENSIQLSAHIKTTYGRPVIGLSGWLEDSYVMRAKQAADFFFPLPAKLVDLMEAFEKCLSMLHR